MGLFGSPNEAYCYFTACMCGVSILLPVNAIFSAPLYIMNFYKYVMKDPDAEPQHTNFWNNVLTYYNLVSIVTSLTFGMLTLLRVFRAVPLRLRMLSSLAFLWLEIILLIVVPAVGSTEVGAIVTTIIAGLISGSGKSVLEATSYGLFSVYPHRFMVSLMGGMGVSGVLTSVVQLIVKAVMPEDYEGIRDQSKIFYGLMLGIQAITFVMLIFLYRNDYAKQFTGALNGDHAHPEEECDTRVVASPKDSPADDSHVVSGSLVATDVLFVLKTVYPMIIACAFTFLITLYLFPTIVVSVDPVDYWYGTVAIFIFNVGDVIGRFATSFKILWPPRWGVIGGCFSRVIFVPLLLLASYHYIPSHAFNYVMMVLFGLSNGYIGGLALILGPKSEGVKTSGQRFVVGTMLGVSILAGGAIGISLSIMTQTLRENAGS